MCIAAASYTSNGVSVCVDVWEHVFSLVSHLVRFKSLPQSVEWTCEPYTDYSFWRVMKKKDESNERTNYTEEYLSFLKTESKLKRASDQMGLQRRRRRRANSEKNVKKPIHRISDFRLLVESARQATTLRRRHRRRRLKRIESDLIQFFFADACDNKHS